MAFFKTGDVNLKQFLSLFTFLLPPEAVNDPIFFFKFSKTGTGEGGWGHSVGHHFWDLPAATIF